PPPDRERACSFPVRQAPEHRLRVCCPPSVEATVVVTTFIRFLRIGTRVIGPLLPLVGGLSAGRAPPVRGRGAAVLGPGRRVICPQHIGVPTAGRAVVGAGMLLAVGAGFLTQPVGRVATGGRHRRMTTSITRVRTTHGMGRARPREATVHLITVGRGWVLRWWSGVAGCGVGEAV